MRFAAPIALFFAGLFATITMVKAQVVNSELLPNTVKAQASKMGQAFVAGDYSDFPSYTYPELLRMMGGKAKMVDVLTKLEYDMKNRGMKILSITFGHVSKILKVGSELQCTVPQHTEIRTPDGRSISTSTLVCISTDGGKAWTFVDTSNKDIATIKRLLPNLSNDIVILPMEPPVQYPN